MTPRPTDFGLALVASACAPEILADDPAANIFGPAAVIPELGVPDAEKEQSRRERYLDQLHASLEADQSPKEPVHISLFPACGGARIVFRLDSLTKGKKRTPSEPERRRLLGLQLADFLTAGGLSTDGKGPMGAGTCILSDAVQAITVECRSPVYFTSFNDRLALVKYDCTAKDIDDLAGLIRRTTARSKIDLPWIKLARFNGIPNPKAANPDYPSLRYNAGVVEIYGIEGDYDGGKLPMAIASARLADIECLVYSTPSSAPEAPRWRVLAPTSKPYPPASRAAFLARVNGLLGGVLADESFVLSQSYYFGGLVDRPAEVIVNCGRRVDLLNDLDALARYQHGSPEPTKPKTPRTPSARLRENDQNPLLVGLRENDNNPVLLAEGWRRIGRHVEKFGVGIDPRGQRAFGLASWLGDIRTSAGEILSVNRIIEMMQAAGYGEIAEDILDRRQCPRGRELVASLAEKLGPPLGEAA